MLQRIIEKNKYGGYTWNIKLDSLFQIFVHGTDTNNFVIEFKEWKWLSFKTHFSFVSNDDLKTAIIESFDKVYNFFYNSPKYNWTKDQKEYKLNEVIRLLESSKFYDPPKKQIKLSEKYKTIIDQFRSMPTKLSIKENDNQLLIYFSSPDSEATTEYKLVENSNTLEIDFIQTNSEGTFPLSWRYSIDIDQQRIMEDFNNDLNKLALEIQKKKIDDMINKILYGI